MDDKSQTEPASPKTGRARSWIGKLGIAYALMAVGSGLVSGLGVFTFGYGKGASYLSNNPAACINCHVMDGHYDSWLNSSHRNVATCNDCHLSHHPIGKWITKADNGFFHSLAFTLDNYHKPIRIKPRNRVVTQNACIHCHEGIAHQMLSVSASDPREPLLCVRCHSDVGHSLRP